LWKKNARHQGAPKYPLLDQEVAQKIFYFVATTVCLIMWILYTRNVRRQDALKDPILDQMAADRATLYGVATIVCLSM
jgi:hypothetical protein